MSTPSGAPAALAEAVAKPIASLGRDQSRNGAPMNAWEYMAMSKKVAVSPFLRLGRSVFDLPWGWQHIALPVKTHQPLYRARQWTHLGFGGFEQTRTINAHAGVSFTGPLYIMVVPLYSVVLVTSVLPLVWSARTIRRGRRSRSGLCPSCGYSLTGNTSGVCPECGTPVPKEPAEKTPRPA